MVIEMSMARMQKEKSKKKNIITYERKQQKQTNKQKNIYRATSN